MASRGTSWKVDDVETLAELWADDSVQIKFNTMVHNGKVWDDLARKYNTQQTGNARSGAQVKEKIKRLKRQYRNRERQLGRSGVGGDEEDTLWKIIDRVEGNRELTSPTFIGDSLADCLPDINKHSLPDPEADLEECDQEVEGRVVDFI